MSSSGKVSPGSASSATPAPASASTSAGLSSGAAPQEIQPVPVTPFENLCLSRPGGLPFIEGLRPADAVVFYYGEYQPQSDNRRKSVAPRPVDFELRPVRGPDGAEKWREEAGTEAKDKQPATPPPIASQPPQAMFDIVPLAEINSATGPRDGNIPWLNNNRPAHVQIPYIQSFTPENIKKLFDSSSPVLYSRELFQADGKDPFINAVRVRAEQSSHNIFVGLPYLGCGLETNDDRIPQDGIENGLKLPCYGGSVGGAEEPDYGMRVWQSWQILFDDTRLALIKSPHSPSSNCAPLFGHQATFGPLHALALIIGNLFRHEIQPLEALRAKVDEDISNIEAEISEHVSLEPGELTEVVRRGYRGIIKDSDGRLERHILNMKTIIVILKKQSSILRDLKTITTNQQGPRYRPAFGNPVPLPKFEGQSEQLKNARAVFEQLIAERGRVLADMNTLLDDVKKWRSELRGELRMVREELKEEEGRHNVTVGLNAALAEQGRVTVKMSNTIARQGQTVSFFAFITAVFLPLEFFAQYLGMMDIKTHRGFWKIAGPVTLGVMILLFVFMYWDDDKIKRFLARVTPYTREKYELYEKKRGILDDANPSRPPTPTNSASPGGGTGDPNGAVAGGSDSSATGSGRGSALSQAAGSSGNINPSTSRWVGWYQRIMGKFKRSSNARNPLSQQPHFTGVTIDPQGNNGTGLGGGAHSSAAGGSGNRNQRTSEETK